MSNARVAKLEEEVDRLSKEKRKSLFSYDNRIKAIENSMKGKKSKELSNLRNELKELREQKKECEANYDNKIDIETKRLLHVKKYLERMEKKAP